jgi:hypothetical protein
LDFVSAVYSQSKHNQTQESKPVMFQSMNPASGAATSLGRMPPLGNAEAGRTEMTEELLPFTLRLVRTPAQLAKAVELRHLAYARHLPGLAETLKEPESADFDDGVAVLLAESKLDGSPLGTMRIQTNEFKSLCLEQSVELPEWLRSRRRAEATRLAVTNDKVSRLVKAILFKAYFVYCRQIGIEWLVIAGRSPIDRQYERMLFKDVFPELGYIPLRHAGNLPHRVMSFHLAKAEEHGGVAQHPMFDFFFQTHHPDMDLTPSLRAMAASRPHYAAQNQGAASIN